MNKYAYLNGTHDLPTLPEWGPFARDVYALSHIADFERGIKFDFFMVPGIFRRSFFLPDPLREAGCAPTLATPDLTFYSIRQQMEGKDELYADISYTQIEKDLWLGRCEFVNNTDNFQAASLLHYARLAPRQEVVPQLPDDYRYLDAMTYSELEFSYFRPDRHLSYGAGRHGEQTYPDTVNSTCLGQPPSQSNYLPCFGEKAGDRVTYTFDAVPGERSITLRALIKEGETPEMQIILNGKASSVKLDGSGKFELYPVYDGDLQGKVELTLISGGAAGGIHLDGLITGPDSAVGKVSFPTIARAISPVCRSGKTENTLLISGSGMNKNYCCRWSMKPSAEREYMVGDFAKLLTYSYGLRQTNYYSFPDNTGDIFCRDAYIIPIEISPRSAKAVYVLYAASSGDEAEKRIAAFDCSEDNLEAIYQDAFKRASQLDCTPAGKQFSYGYKMLAAAALTNVNFPIRAEGSNIRHHVPDKHFNSLYSWDSGFIGIGFSELDKIRAVENLNVYVTDPSNEHNAFILWGTPLPVQIYLYMELFNRYQDTEMLEYFYPRLRHYYEFLTGRIENSIFNTAKSHLLRPWKYCYNSGGWDDYPPQWYVLETAHHTVAPVVTTSHTIRFAKILRRAAEMLGKHSDIELYNSDIEIFSSALQKYSWDSEENIFSYVEHDENGEPAGFFRDPVSGRNFNLGMDGATPLNAGICTPEQRQKLFERLSSPDAMWTDAGISTVDRRAPYFRTDGYWNGCVWMPHQWFFWKSALDYNQSDFARRIALTALNMWEKEVRATNYCFEHFSITSLRGAGCCHFGGLSSPILNWFGAYCRKNRLTAGFDTWVLSSQSDENSFTAELLIEGEKNDFCTVLYTAGDGEWSAEYNGIAVPCVSEFPGCLEITLPKASKGLLKLKRTT